MRFIRSLLKRFWDWLGIVAEDPDDLPVDPLVSPARDAWMSEERAERIKSGEEECPHLCAYGLGELDMSDPEKIFYCGDCGLTYRLLLDPAKPWHIRAYVPVRAKR